VTPALPLSLVALDDTVVLVARTPRARAVTDRDAVLALRALAESEWDRARPADDALAPTEDTLLRLLAEGKTDSAVAARLGVSPRTVRRHAAGLMGRLGATSRFEPGPRAAQRGWTRRTARRALTGPPPRPPRRCAARRTRCPPGRRARPSRTRPACGGPRPASRPARAAAPPPPRACGPSAAGRGARGS